MAGDKVGRIKKFEKYYPYNVRFTKSEKKKFMAYIAENKKKRREGKDYDNRTGNDIIREAVMKEIQ